MENIKTFTKKLIEKIKKYNTILIFHHERPDPDALGSAYGLEAWLKLNFPNKYVAVSRKKYAALPYIFPKQKTIPTSKFKDALGITLDIGDKKRIDDQRFELCKEMIKIDHHPFTEKFGELEYFDPAKSSACQIVAEILISLEDKFKTNKKIYEYLFAGMVTDTGRFLYGNMDEKTFEVLSHFFKKEINISEVYRSLYTRSIKDIKFHANIQEKIKTTGDVAYYIMPINYFKKFGVEYELAKNNVNMMSQIKGINKWLFASYDNKLRKWCVSLRSNGVTINEVAKKFGGGGHKNAAAFKTDDKTVISKVIELLKKL